MLLPGFADTHVPDMAALLNQWPCRLHRVPAQVKQLKQQLRQQIRIVARENGGGGGLGGNASDDGGDSPPAAAAQPISAAAIVLPPPPWELQSASSLTSWQVGARPSVRPLKPCRLRINSALRTKSAVLPVVLPDVESEMPARRPVVPAATVPAHATPCVGCLDQFRTWTSAAGRHQ